MYRPPTALLNGLLQCLPAETTRPISCCFCSNCTRWPNCGAVRLEIRRLLGALGHRRAVRCSKISDGYIRVQGSEIAAAIARRSERPSSIEITNKRQKHDRLTGKLCVDMSSMGQRRWTFLADGSDGLVQRREFVVCLS